MRLIDADALAEKLGINEECKDCQYYNKFKYRCIRYGSSFTDVCEAIYDAPTVQPDLPEAYAKKVWTWLLDYQTTAAELKAKYSAYEVLSWVVNDWRRGHGGLN